MKHAPSAALAVLTLLASAQAVAQSPGYMDFAKHSEVTEVSLSPDGKHVALAVPTPDGMETVLQIVPLDGSGQGQVLRFGKQQHVTDITWSDDTQLVVSRAKMEPLRARPISQGDLFSTDLSGKNQRTLFAYVEGASGRAALRKDRGFATLVKVLDDEPGKVLVDFTAWPDSAGDEKLTTSIYKWIPAAAVARKPSRRGIPPISTSMQPAARACAPPTTATTIPC